MSCWIVISNWIIIGMWASNKEGPGTPGIPSSQELAGYWWVILLFSELSRSAPGLDQSHPANRLARTAAFGPVGYAYEMDRLNCGQARSTCVTDLLDSAHLRNPCCFGVSSLECVNPCPKKRRFPASFFSSFSLYGRRL